MLLRVKARRFLFCCLSNRLDVNLDVNMEKHKPKMFQSTSVSFIYQQLAFRMITRWTSTY